jgi:hypothetical protein
VEVLPLVNTLTSDAASEPPTTGRRSRSSAHVPCCTKAPDTLAPSTPNRTNSCWSVVMDVTGPSSYTQPAVADRAPMPVTVPQVTPSADIWYAGRHVNSDVAPSSQRATRASLTSVVLMAPVHGRK